MTPDDIIESLQLQPHPEGGWYRQTWMAENAGRPTATCIYFLLAKGERSHWHRVDATEIWLWHAGDPLILSISATDSGPARDHHLGPDFRTGHPQQIVPENHWQSARSTGAFSLVSCVVSPGFRFEGFDLAPAGFDIPRSPV
ncbi:MAG: cupin domain-containing protein [Pseudomonadota bacterium]